jgi:excisionase family DNA binding protein
MVMQPDRLWTVAEVAEYLAVTERTVRAWQTDHRLPFLKIGGVIRFRPADLMAWVDDFEESTVDRA